MTTIHTNSRVLVVEGPHQGDVGKVVKVLRIYDGGTNLKQVEIERDDGVFFRTRVAFVRPEGPTPVQAPSDSFLVQAGLVVALKAGRDLAARLLDIDGSFATCSDELKGFVEVADKALGEVGKK